MPPPTEPTAPADEPGAASGGQLAWDRRGELGLPAALAATVKRFALSPVGAFAAAGPGLRSAITYALAIGALGAVFDAFGDAAITYLFSSESPALGRIQEFFAISVYGRSLEAPILSALGCWLSLIIGVPVLLLVLPFFVAYWSGVAHLASRLLAPASRPGAGFSGTLRVVCYSLTSVVAQVVPFLGEVVTPVWMVVLQTLGLAETHGLSRSRALIAALSPALLLAAVVVAMAIFGD